MCRVCGHNKKFHDTNLNPQIYHVKHFCNLCCINAIKPVETCWHDYVGNLEYLEQLYEAKCQ